ncbi:MAG: hypothetical protein ACP5RN_14180, partial [Armatimonadota bacterium]
LGLCTLLVAASAAEIKVRDYKGHPYVQYDPTTMVLGLSPGEAERRLLEWMNVPGLQIRLIGVTAYNLGMLREPASWPLYAPYWSPGDELSYLFEDNFGKLYVVAIVPIALWEYKDPTCFGVDEGERSQWIPREQLREVAMQFLAERRPNFLAEAHFTTERYGSLAVRTLYQGIPHNRAAVVEVHKRLGRVSRCLWRDPGIPEWLSTTPSISQQRARQLAVGLMTQMPGAISAVVDESVFRSGLDVYSDTMGNTRLLWHFPISVTFDNDAEVGVGETYIVAVDAHTGDVFVFDETVGASAQQSTDRPTRRVSKKPQLRVLRCLLFGSLDVSQLLLLPPLEIDGVVYLHVGWLRSPMFGVPAARVVYDPALREVSVVFEGKRWRFSAGSRKVFSDKGQMVLPHPVRNIRSRIYLPLCAIERMTGWRGQVSEDRLVLSRPLRRQ